LFRTALLEAGFTPDDYFYDAESPAYQEEGQGAPGTAGSSFLIQVRFLIEWLIHT